MANQDIEAVFRNLNNELKDLSNVVSTQGISQFIPSFDGTPSKFKEWIKNIEKYSLLMNIPQGRLKLIAYQTSTGSVNSYLDRFLANNENINWPQVKAELATIFAFDVTDKYLALNLLRECKQERGENVSIYAERLLSLSEEAYVNDPSAAKIIDSQLIGFFIDGLYHDYLKLKVMRENPDSFKQAIEIAQNEQNLRKRLNLRSGKINKNRSSVFIEEISNNINNYKAKKYCKNCQKPGHLARNCRVSIVCWNCKKNGHIKRNCKDKRNKRKTKAKMKNKKKGNCKALFMMGPIKSAKLKTYQALVLIQQEVSIHVLLKLINSVIALCWTQELCVV